MELADKKIKNVVCCGKEADLNEHVEAKSFDAVAKAFGAKLRSDSQKNMSSLLMKHQAGRLSL